MGCNPWTQDSSLISSFNVASALPEETGREWRRENEILRYLREFCEEALGLKGLEDRGWRIVAWV